VLYSYTASPFLRLRRISDWFASKAATLETRA
jgi:hypothetical protein